MCDLLLVQNNLLFPMTYYFFLSHCSLPQGWTHSFNGVIQSLSLSLFLYQELSLEQAIYRNTRLWRAFFAARMTRQTNMKSFMVVLVRRLIPFRILSL